MKITVISGSLMGTNTRTAMDAVMKEIKKQAPQAETELIDLAEYEIQFSDGRNVLDYDGDTKYVAEAVMEADALVIGTPIFQASIPGSLKNVFDLLPPNALYGKVAGIVATAGSSKHFLIPEIQLKPILAYLDSQIVQNIVFIEEQDFDRKTIINDDVFFRIERLVEDTLNLTETYLKIREKKEAEYGF